MLRQLRAVSQTRGVVTRSILAIPSVASARLYSTIGSDWKATSSRRSFTDTATKERKYGFDLSQEDFDTDYAVIGEGVWGPCYSLSETHHPVGRKEFGIINNRGFIMTVAADGEKSLLMSGLPGDGCVAKMKKLEQDTGLKLKQIVGSGDFHHMAMRYWLDAFPDVRIMHSGLKFPNTRNGKEILAIPDYASRITMIDGNDFSALDKYSQEVQFFGFNQCYTYTDKEYMPKDSKNHSKEGFFSFMKNFAGEKLDQKFLAVWLYHVPTKTLVFEHNFNIYYSKGHKAQLPLVMKMMLPKETFGSIRGPMPAPPSLPEECAIHCKQMARLLELDVRQALDYHSLPGVFARQWDSQEAYRSEMYSTLEKTGEHLPDGSAMGKKSFPIVPLAAAGGGALAFANYMGLF